jgi:hypothetical protein
VAFQDLRFRFVTVKPSEFFGYCRETLGDVPVLIADEAKAIVDSLDQPRYAGGAAEVARALRAVLEVVDVSILVAPTCWGTRAISITTNTGRLEDRKDCKIVSNLPTFHPSNLPPYRSLRR